MSAATPAERSLAARVASLTRWSNADPVAETEKARAAGPGRIDYWLAQQPDDLPEHERLRRAECAKKAHYARLGLASAKARRRKAS